MRLLIEEIRTELIINGITRSTLYHTHFWTLHYSNTSDTSARGAYNCTVHYSYAIKDASFYTESSKAVTTYTLRSQIRNTVSFRHSILCLLL